MKLYDNTKNLALLKVAVDSKMPVLLVGETGVGKTTIIRENAKFCGKPLTRVNLNGQTGIEEIAGKWLIAEGKTYWQDGILTTAMRKGEWIVFDEINSANAEILFFLNPLLDDDRAVLLAEKDGERVTPHDNFRFFATMNPSDEYSGTKEMNKALLSRFGIILNVDPLPQAEETELLTEYTAPDQAKELAKIGAVLREEKIKGELYYFCSTRDLIYLAKLLKCGADKNDAITSGIILKANKDEQEKIAELIKAVVSGFKLTKTEQGLEDIKALEARLQKSKMETMEAKSTAKNLEKKASDSLEMLGMEKLDNNKKIEEILKKIYDVICESCKDKMEALFESGAGLEGKGEGIKLPFKPKAKEGASSAEAEAGAESGKEGEEAKEGAGAKTRKPRTVDPKNPKNIKVGSMVKIGAHSKFWGQSFLKATVISIQLDGWCSIKFSDGSSNTYPMADLFKVRTKKEEPKTEGEKEVGAGEPTNTLEPTPVTATTSVLSLSGKAISDSDLVKIQSA